ncbi:aminotransferase class I/II-fold pyridoxal phosphate-dependent enzyme [Saccharopolyspora rosea]|uniref:cysteine-S-conjugate beta-lyase n=1 Tax=Saccharopolyspora rosea TaxID=524884 RepID=A0ABW3G4B9_9PSEU
MDDLHATLDALRETDLRQRRTTKWADVDDDVLPAWIAEMDYPLCPVAREAARAVIERGELGYPLTDDYAAAFADWSAREHGRRPDPALVAPVADVMAGLEAALRALTEPGDGVVLLTPAYPPFLRLLAELDRPLRACPLRDTDEGWAIDFDAVDAALAGGARAVLLCHPHNPTGRVWTPDELRALAALADRRGAAVVSDEVHAPLLADGAGFVPYAATGDLAASHAVTVTSASKAWNIPGLKSAVLLGEEATRHVVDGLPPYERRASVPGLAAAAALWRDDGGWLASVRAYLDRTRDRLRTWVADRPDVRWHPGQAGYLAWLDLRATGLGADPAGILLEKARVRVNPGTDFAPPDSAVGRGFVRFNHATSLPLLDEILTRLDRALG